MNIRNAFLIVASVSFALVAQATTHVIKFGNTLGKIYEPKVLTGVAIGDTIQWEGYFQFHPLLATQLPETAPEFYYDDIDTVFIYIPQVNGEYRYICTAHEGMEGSFIVGGSNVDASMTFALTTFPNPVTNSLTISFSLTKAASAAIAIFDIHGKQVTSAREAFGAGRNTTNVSLAVLPAGFYYYRLETPEGSFIRKFTIAR